MVGAILLCAGIGLFVLVLVGLAKSIQKHEKLGKELNNRLMTLEDRFYHPANYKDAFFRVVPEAKKKTDAKEG
jgi:hypothetical protein